MATTPVFLPGESLGHRSLVGYSPQSHSEVLGVKVATYEFRADTVQPLTNF